MKTAKEVKQWLERKSWYKDFKDAVIENYIYDSEFKLRILNGEFLERTISGAFQWDRTKEGHDVWHDRNLEFKNWFYSIKCK